MGDPFLRMADEWDRNDGLDEFYGETKQELAERLGTYSPVKNGKTANDGGVDDVASWADRFQIPA
jgi:hypothetical protein